VSLSVLGMGVACSATSLGRSGGGRDFEVPVDRKSPVMKRGGL
jgi:hypothetical protein